jgi:hypothetical protein
MSSGADELFLPIQAGVERAELFTSTAAGGRKEVGGRRLSSVLLQKDLSQVRSMIYAT